MSDLTQEDAQEYPYESIQKTLQKRAIESLEPHKRGIMLDLSTKTILAITSQVVNHLYFQRLGRPDFTKYTIDFKIWQDLFADEKGESTIPFTAVDPLIARPLDGKVDFSSMPPNPFPVLVPGMGAGSTHHHGTPQMRGGYDGIQTGSHSNSNNSMESQFRSMPSFARNDSGYHDNSGESSTGAQQAEHAEGTIAARRNALEQQRLYTINEARRFEDEARKFSHKGRWMMEHAERLMQQLIDLNDDEEFQFSIEDRLIQLQTERNSIDDEMKRLYKKVERKS